MPRSIFTVTCFRLPGRGRRRARFSIVATLAAGLLLPWIAGAQISPPTYDFVQTGVQSAKVDNSTGVPRLLINGQPVPPLLFFYNSRPQDRIQHLAPQVKLSAAAGIHVYSFPFDHWPWDPGDSSHPPDWSSADAQLDRFIAADPHAVFLLRVGVWPPPNWSGWATYTEWGKDEDNLYSDGTSAIISVASDRYFDAFIAAIKRMVQHYESSPYARRILGYHIEGQSTGEWFPMNYGTKGLDYSPANSTAFRDWLSRKYGTDQALSSAWGRFTTLAGAAIPVPGPNRFPLHGAAQGDVVQQFYSLPAEQDWVDYSDYISDIMSSRILASASAVRQATKGQRIIAFFYGYIYGLAGSMTGHLRMDRILDSPDIDLVGAPISYTPIEERLGGGAASAMSARDSVALHGKLWMNEDDLKTHVAADLPDLGYNGDLKTVDAFEMSHVLQRNLASSLIHRGGTWWMDLNATGAFNDAGAWKVFSDFGLPLYDELYSNPTPYRPDVAVITDDRSVIYQKSDWDMLFVSRILPCNAFAKSGASVGYYDLNDFLNGLLPPAKVYVFLNAFSLDDFQTQAIRIRLERDGATAVWQYAPGYLGPAGADVSRIQALTGIQIAISPGFSGSNGSSYLSNVVWGWAWRTPWEVLSPRFVVDDPDASALGHYWSDGLVSTAAKQVAGFTSIFVGDVGWNTAMLTRLLAAAGVHIWTSGNIDVIHTDGSLLVIHAGAEGTRNINLPTGITASTLGGDILASHPQRLQTSFTRAGETQWFRLSTTPDDSSQTNH